MDPITISLVVLGTTFATEGIKFLWKQADTIVNRYNDRKYKAVDTAQEQAESALTTVETSDAPKFLDLPPTLTIDFDRAKEKAAKLAILSEALTPYMHGEKLPDAADDDLKDTLDTVQQMVEYVYHQSFAVTEETRRNVVEATSGGSIQVDENVQHITSTGENVIRADGNGSSVTLGKSKQTVG